MHVRPHFPTCAWSRAAALTIVLVACASDLAAQQLVGAAPGETTAAQTAPYSSAAAEGIPASYTGPAPAPLSAPALLPSGTAERAANPLTPQDGKPRTRLAPPGTAAGESRSRAAGGAATVIASLALVLGLFVVAAWVLRRGMPRQNRSLPKEAVESLGRIPFPGRQQGQLLRVGNKLVLVSFSTAGADVITEVTDPIEVDRLAGLCAQSDPHAAVRSFREVVDGFFRDKPAAGLAHSGRRTAEEDDVA